MKLSVIMLACLALAGCANDPNKRTAMDYDSSSSNTVASWDGVVQSIDNTDSSMAAAGAVGAAAAGVSGYRVTVKKLDGTTEVINVENMPSYRVGDNVRYSKGQLSASPKY